MLAERTCERLAGFPQPIGGRPERLGTHERGPTRRCAWREPFRCRRVRRRAVRRCTGRCRPLRHKPADSENGRHRRTGVFFCPGQRCRDRPAPPNSGILASGHCQTPPALSLERACRNRRNRRCLRSLAMLLHQGVHRHGRHHALHLADRSAP